MPIAGKGGPQQGPSPAVVQALKEYEKQRSDAALQGVLRLVEDGTHGSAACVAAVKVLCLHAAQVCERQRGPQAEEPVARLLLQALEAAVHGTLLYRSIQLLEAVHHLLLTTSGSAHFVEQRQSLLSLLDHGADAKPHELRGLQATPLLPLRQLTTAEGVPRTSHWWNTVPFADWVPPALEAVGGSTFPWECAPPHSNPGQYHEAALQHTATFTHAMTRDFVHRVHDSAEQTSKRNPEFKKLRHLLDGHKQTQTLPERLARSDLLPRSVAAELRKKLGVKSEAEREVALLVSKPADKAPRRREQLTAEERKRALQRKRREEREARELAEAHSRAKVVADYLRLKLEQAGAEGNAADPLAVVCQVARMPWPQVLAQVAELPGAQTDLATLQDGENASSKEKEMFELYEQVRLAAYELANPRRAPQEPLPLYRSPFKHSHLFSPEGEYHQDRVASLAIPTQPEDLLKPLESLGCMKGVLEASEELRRAANELLPRLGAMCVLHPEDEPAFWSEEELRGSPAGMLAKRYHISTPRTHVPKHYLEAVPVLAHPSIPYALLLPQRDATVADVRELCGLPPLRDSPPSSPSQHSQAAAPPGSQPWRAFERRSGSCTPDACDAPEDVDMWHQEQQQQQPQPQRRQWAWVAEEVLEEDEVDILQAIGTGPQQQQQQPAAAEAAGSQDPPPQPVPGRRRLLSMRRMSSSSSSDSGGSSGGGRGGGPSSSAGGAEGSRPASGLVVEESEDAASDADTASAAGAGAAVGASSRSSSAQSSRTEDLDSSWGSSSSSSSGLWSAEKLARQLERAGDAASSGATRSRSTSRYCSSPERGSSPVPLPRMPTAASSRFKLESATMELKRFLGRQAAARRGLRGLFCAEQHLADMPAPVPPAYSKAPILRLAHTVLDRSLRPVLLGTWLLRCVEQVEPSVLCHMADFQAFGTEDMLLSADEAELACLAALWRSPQLLNELVQQAEPADVAQRVEAIMKDQMSSLLRREDLKPLPGADSDEGEALDDVRLDVQLEYSSRVIRAILFGGQELQAAARPVLEAGSKADEQSLLPVLELGGEASKYKHRLVCYVVRALRLLRETHRLTRPLWGTVAHYLVELRNEQVEIKHLELEAHEAELEMGRAYTQFLQAFGFTEREFQIWQESLSRSPGSDPDPQDEEDVAKLFHHGIYNTDEGKAWRDATAYHNEAERRLRAAKSASTWWECRSNNSEGSDDLSSSSHCADDGSEPWLGTLVGMSLGALEQLYAFLATQVALSYDHVSDISPMLKAALDQPNALAALQLRAEPAASEEGEPSKPCFELALRPQGLARVLGPQRAASTDQLVASFANFAAGLVPLADDRQGPAAGVAAAAAPAEQASVASGRSEGHSKRAGATRASSGALPDAPGTSGRGTAGDAQGCRLDDTFERQEALHDHVLWAARQLLSLMVAAGCLGHIVRGVVDMWEGMMMDDDLGPDLAAQCRQVAQVGTRDNNVVKLVSQLGTAVLQLCCVVDRTADLCSAFSSTIQLGAINRFCQVLEEAQGRLADGQRLDPLELGSDRPVSPADLADRLHECREEAQAGKEEVERMLKRCGRDVWAWLRSKDQSHIAATAQPLVKLRDAAGDWGYGLYSLDFAEKVRLSKAAAQSLLEVLDQQSSGNCAYLSARDEAEALLALQAECHTAALRLLSATWSCHGGMILPLDGAARAMLRYLLPPVWKQELDVVEEERRQAAQAALMQEEEDRAAAAEAAAAKRKAKKKKSKKAAGADEKPAQQQQQQQQAAAEEAQAEEGEEAATEESLEDLALLLGSKQPLPAQQPAQQPQQAAATQPGAAAAQEQPQESKRRKGRKKGEGGSGDGAAAAAAEEEQQPVPEGYLRMMAELQAAEQANEQQRQQQRQQHSQLQQQQGDQLDPEVLQMLEAMDVSERAAQQQQAAAPPPVARAQAAAPLPVAPAQQRASPPPPPQRGVAGVQPSASEQDHSLEAQLAAASAFDWTTIEGAEAEASWQSSSSAAPAPAPDWQDASASSHRPRHQAAAAGAAKEPAAAPAPAAVPRKSIDRSKPRVVDWDGGWICKCGRAYTVRDACKPCGVPVPCRDFLKGCCAYPGTCNFTHLQFDLPAEGPPPGSKPLVCPPRSQQQPKPTAPKPLPPPQHDERLARVVSWRGEYVCPCGTRRFMQHACATCGYGPVCRDWVRGRCEFGASCRFSHPLFDLAGAPSVPSEERVVLGRLSDLPQWRPPGAASSTAARPTSRPGTASSAAARRPQSGSSAQSVLLSAPEAAVAAVCAQFGMSAEDLEAMLGPDGLQDALEQVQVQEAERASLQASSAAAAQPAAPAPAPAAPHAPLPPPPPPPPVSAAPAGPAAQYAEPARPASAASQASSGGVPAQSSSAGGMRIVSSSGAWVCHCGASNAGKRARCKRESCVQLAPCRKWMLGACPAAHCQYPHPPFDPAGDWGVPRGGEPKAVLWQGAPLFGAPQPATAAPQPVAAAHPEAPAQDDGDLNALLQNLGIGDSSDGGWGDEAQGGGSAAAAHISGMVPAAAHGAGVAAPAHMHLPAMATPGLQNEAGEYNCFLNAIIQCLWRCANFRQQLAAWGPAVCGQDPVVSALYSLFAAFAAEEQQLQQAGPLQSTAARRGLVNPSELRQALSALPGPQQYRVGEMNDAGEVLLTIYERVMEVLPQQEGAQASPIQRIFGLPVDEHVHCHSCGRVTQQCSYTQFYHNIQAASLQAARGLYPQADSMLMLMRLLEQQHMKTCDQDVGGCGLKNSVRHTLLRPPRVFTLQLGWKSQREQPHNIAATLAVVDETVNLADFYEGVPPRSPHYALRSMVCYYGQHYSAFVWAPDSRAWLLFDDVRVSRVGSWAAVRRKCEAGRIQPSVLFYEAVA